LKKELVEYVAGQTGTMLNPDALTIVWARRFAGYKRPGLLFSDIKKLFEITHLSDKPVQIIIAGKAHPGDREGNELIEKIKAYAKSEDFAGKIVYLPHYSIRVARILTSGADVWLNTPERGKEACGTSGMKSGLNGVLQCSILDGWMGETNWDELGWTLPEENTDKRLYEILEQDIVGMFYNRNSENLPIDWVIRMQKTMNTISSTYSLDRTLRRYFEQLYGAIL
jgi:starch phosphorylase